MEFEYVKVHTLSNRFEADVITDALRQEGIPVIVRQFMETPYADLFVLQKGWGRIMVPKEMADMAREIISGLLQEEEEVIDMPSAGDPQVESRLWDALRQADPEEIAAAALVDFDAEEKAYVVPLLNTTVRCYAETEETEVPGRLEDLSNDFQLNLVVLHYLLGASNKPPANRWVSERDLPGGSFFFTASHKLPTDFLAGAFDGRTDSLNAAAQSMGGEKINLGNLSYRFRILPRIPIALIFWARDEEFEPSFSILFDETIMAHLGSLDLVWGLVNLFARILLDSAASLSETQ